VTLGLARTRPNQIYLVFADRATAWQVYYYNKQAQRTEVRGCWCHSCWNEAKEGLVQLDGSTVPKKDLDKRKNDEEVCGA